MSVAGNYVLHYSWGCSSTYSQSSISFNGNGTFGGSLAGKWHQREGTLLLMFDAGPAKYGGTMNGNVGSGAMSTFEGSTGCWYLTKEGTQGVAPPSTVAQGARQPFDASGTPNQA